MKILKRATKAVSSCILRKSSKGNMLSSIGCVIAIVALTLPFFVKSNLGTASSITGIEYLYGWALDSTGYPWMALSIALCATVAIGTLLMGGRRFFVPANLVSAAVLFAACVFMPVPLTHIGFGVFICMSGLVIAAVGCIVKW